MNEKYKLKCLVDSDEQEVVIDTYENDNDVEIRFLFKNLIISRKADNFFEALVSLRKELEKREVKLLCKGCCINVYPSAMILEMGAGRKAYCLVMGEQAKMSSLVDIFESCEVNEYSSVDEQFEFFNQWIESLGR